MSFRPPGCDMPHTGRQLPDTVCDVGDSTERQHHRTRVVIPAYNAERFVGGAVRSALAQTVGDVGVVVVDDGSADRTADAARAVADPRVTVMTTANGGPSRARNLGARLAPPAEYLAFLDADDLWDPGKLASQLARLDAEPDLVVVGCHMRYVSSSGAVLGRAGLPIDDGARGRIARGELFPFPMSSLVVRGAAFEAVGGFDEQLGRVGSEDLDLLARLARVGRVACVPEALGAYRVHPGSAMARHRRRINQAARFVRARLAAADAGRALTWDEFAATYRPGWRDRWSDLVEVLYRSAAVGYAERRLARACAYGALALATGPRYTLGRLRDQQGRRSRRSA